MIGFPPRFKRTEQLKTFMVRFLWNNLFHATVNYALIPHFVPVNPAKLYKYTDGAKISFMKAVPDADHSIVSFIINVKLSLTHHIIRLLSSLRPFPFVQEALIRTKGVFCT